jgi:hypothetical protein
MATRTASSSSSSSSETEVTSTRIREISETSGNTTQTGSRIQGGSPTNTIDGTSFGDTTTARSASPSASHASTAANRSAYDTVSVTTSSNTNITNATRASQLTGGIPIIRPPVLQQQHPGSGIGVFGPQRPGGYPTQPPIQVDVRSAQQQYQQRTVQPEISPYGQIVIFKNINFNNLKFF